jgi:hypothetical protein
MCTTSASIAHPAACWPCRRRLAAALQVLEEAADAHSQHLAHQRYRPHRLELVDPGVLHSDSFAKYAVAFLDVALHLHPRQFGTQPRQLHLLGTDRPVSSAVQWPCP